MDDDQIIVDLKVNVASFGVCRMDDNRRDGFMWEEFRSFFDGRINGGRNTRFREENIMFYGAYEGGRAEVGG